MDCLLWNSDLQWNRHQDSSQADKGAEWTQMLTILSDIQDCLLRCTARRGSGDFSLFLSLCNKNIMLLLNYSENSFFPNLHFMVTKHCWRKINKNKYIISPDQDTSKQGHIWTKFGSRKHWWLFKFFCIFWLHHC